jgi:hypothetical protein
LAAKNIANSERLGQRGRRVEEALDTRLRMVHEAWGTAENNHDLTYLGPVTGDIQLTIVYERLDGNGYIHDQIFGLITLFGWTI